jgi:hypothetical protein
LVNQGVELRDHRFHLVDQRLQGCREPQ